MLYNLNHYCNQVHIRSNPLDGLDGWVWICEDGKPGSDGGVWTGPINDWISSHSEKFFKYVKNFDTVIQAGGALGMYPRLLANRFRFVYTFEPDPLNFFCLVNNCQVDTIIKINAALGEKNEFAQIHRADLSNAGTHAVQLTNNGRIPIMSIDSFNFNACDLILLDVEGFEYPAIKGAANTIEKFKPVIIAEHSRDTDVEQLLDFLTSRGYKQVDQSISDFIFVAE